MNLKKQIKKGFSLVELIIVVVIIGLLSGVAYIGIQRSQVKANNEKMLDDLIAIANALEQYRLDNGGNFPTPPLGDNQNVTCYDASATYTHDCQNAAFIQGMVDNQLLTTRYLREVPTDPRTGSRYVYGMTGDGKYYAVAGLYQKENGWEARVQGNLEKGFHLPSIIRSFDGPNFVVERGEYLPYNPDHLTLVATARNVVGDVKAEGQPLVNGTVLPEGSTITTGLNSSADIYFSDGSITSLEAESDLKLENLVVKNNDKEGIGTKIKLLLKSGKIWNKVIRLSKESEFNVETTGAIAGVRGTEFGVDAAMELVVVRSGKVEVSKQGVNPVLIEEVGNKDVEPTAWKKVSFSGNNLSGVLEAIGPEKTEVVAQNYKYIELHNNMVPRVLAVNPGSNIVVENLYTTLGLDAMANELRVSGVLISFMDKNGAAQTTKVSVDPKSLNHYSWDLQGLEMKQMTLQFVYEAGGILMGTSGSSSPALNIDGMTELKAQDINPNVVREPALSVFANPSQPLDQNGKALFTIHVEVLNFDFAEALKKDPGFKGLTYLVSDAKNLCQKTIAAPPLLTKSVEPIPMENNAPNAVGPCELTVKVDLPGGATISGEVVVLIRAAEQADPMLLGQTPLLTGVAGVPDFQKKELSLNWVLDLKGHMFKQWEFFDSNNKPVPAKLGPNGEKGPVLLDISAPPFAPGPNKVVLRLTYEPKPGAPETLEQEYLFNLGELTLLRFELTDKNNRPLPSPLTVEAGKPLEVRALVAETNVQKYPQGTGADISGACLWKDGQDNPVDLAKGFPMPNNNLILKCQLPAGKIQDVRNEVYLVIGDVLKNAVVGVNVQQNAVVVNAPAKTLADVCTNVPGSRLFRPAAPQAGCWLMAQANESCSQACDNQLDPQGYNASCAVGGWNDDVDGVDGNPGKLCDICGLLTGVDVKLPGVCGVDITNLSPFSTGTTCRYRNIGLNAIQDCNAPGVAPKVRICKCE